MMLGVEITPFHDLLTAQLSSITPQILVLHYLHTRFAFPQLQSCDPTHKDAQVDRILRLLLRTAITQQSSTMPFDLLRAINT